MLIWSILSIFGLLIVHRTLIECETLQIIPSRQLTRVRSISFLTVIAFNLSLRDHVGILLLLNFAVFLSPWWLPLSIQKRRESALKNHFLVILDSLILALQSGKALRPALLAQLEVSSPNIRYPLQEFLSALRYQKEAKQLSRDREIQFFFHELSEIHRSAHKPIDRLKALRRRLIMERNFRQKSRQALLQVRFQSWIMVIMYLAASFFVAHQFGIRPFFGLFCFSSILFAVGFCFVQRMGRAYRWKI